MNWLAAAPTLEQGNIRLEPLSVEHLQGLITATQDGELWNIRVTSAPHPDQVAAYIEHALQQREQQQQQKVDQYQQALKQLQQEMQPLKSQLSETEWQRQYQQRLESLRSNLFP